MAGRIHRLSSFVLATFAVALALLVVVTAGARATIYQASCATLQEDLEKAGADPGGGAADTVTLDGMCGASALNSGTYLIPAASAFAFEAAPSTVAGFNAPSTLGGNAQLEDGGPVAGMTLSGLTFEGSSHGALVLHHGAGALTLRGDRFLGNHATLPSPVEIIDNNSGCPGGVADGSVTITGSLFENGVGDAGAGGEGDGGGMVLDIDCGLNLFTLSANTFHANTLTPASGQPGSGAGLAIYNGDKANNIPQVTQTGNVFEANAVVADGTGNYHGGGELTSGVDLSSSGDRFSNNALPGTSTGHFSWGAGLSVENSGCQIVSPSSTLANDAIVANTIADTPADSPEAALGAGLYVGCGAPKGYANHLALLDSTVTANAVTPAGVGAIAGIGGHPSDQLLLANTILFGDSGGAELGGFTGAGGALAASYSDLCNGSAPFPGQGNICANPLLAGGGNPSSIDVHETSVSPTIDAGSNALLPSGLTSDLYGSTRIQPGSSYTHFGCGASAGPILPTFSPAIVDIGAAESGPFPRPVPVPSCAPRPPFRIISIRVLTAGRIVVTLGLLSPGRAAASASVRLERSRRIRVHGHTRRVVVRLTTIAYGSASHTVTHAGRITLELKPGRRALSLLKRRHELSVHLKLAFAATGGDAHALTSQAVSVTFKPSRKRRHARH